MPEINRHTNRRIRLTVYKLKRLYGGTIFLYSQGNPTTDLETGVKSWPGRTVTRIERAIILPVKYTSEQVQTISMISADKKFVYGGVHNRGARWFYIDPRDLPSGYQIDDSNHIVYGGKQYEVKDVRDTEFDSLWEVLGSEVEGVIPQQIHELTGKHIIDFQQSGDAV